MFRIRPDPDPQHWPNITFGWSELLKILGGVLQLSGQGGKPVPGNQFHPFRVQGQAKVPNQ
jgi:hypothetical protein